MSTTTPTGLDANTEALLRADIERVLAKYNLQASDVKVDLGSAALRQGQSTPTSPPRAASEGDPDCLNATCTPYTLDGPAPGTPREAPATGVVPLDTNAAPSHTMSPGVAAVGTLAAPTEAASASALPGTGGLPSTLDLNSLIPELQVEIDRQRQRDERDRLLKGFTGKSVLLADKKKRDEERQLNQPHARGFSAGKTNNVRMAAAAAAAVAAAASKKATPIACSTATPSTARPGSRSGSGAGSRPGSRHTAVSLPDDPPLSTSEGCSGSERHNRSGASIPVFSILAKDGDEGVGGATSGCGASGTHLNHSVSLKEAPAPVDLTHTPLIGEGAAAVQKQSILRNSNLCTGCVAPSAGTTLPKLSANRNTSQPITPMTAAALTSHTSQASPPPPAPMSRDEMVQDQIARSRANQQRVSGLSSPSKADNATTAPPTRTVTTRLSLSLTEDAAHRPSLRELLAAQERDGRAAVQELDAHRKRIDYEHHSSGVGSAADWSPARRQDLATQALANGLTPSPPQPVTMASVPVPPLLGGSPRGSPRTSVTSTQRPTSSASGRSPSARCGIQLCRVTLPSEPKARAEVMEQFSASTAGQEVLGTKNRYEHMLAIQQQLLESRKKDEQQYHEIVAKAVELNQKLQGP